MITERPPAREVTANVRVGSRYVDPSEGVFILVLCFDVMPFVIPIQEIRMTSRAITTSFSMFPAAHQLRAGPPGELVAMYSM